MSGEIGGAGGADHAQCIARRLQWQLYRRLPAWGDRSDGSCKINLMEINQDTARFNKADYSI